MNRREFLLLAGALVGGCQAENTGSAPGGPARVIDAGSAANYSADGLYAAFRDQGFFIIRKGGKLFALSSYCTHRKCKLDSESDHSFSCPCHGSTFDPAGKVTEGPATRDLPTLPSELTAAGHLLVTVLAG
jgi:cytochrome b6-f complex iron-sulfur subunit